MLSCEGNENGGKTTIGLISKKQLGTLQHTFFFTFLCRCFARLQKLQKLFVCTSLSSLSHALRRSNLWICSGYMMSSHA